MKNTIIAIAIGLTSLVASAQTTITLTTQPANASNTIGTQSSTGFRPSTSGPVTLTIKSTPTYGGTGTTTYTPAPQNVFSIPSESAPIFTERAPLILNCGNGCDFTPTQLQRPAYVAPTRTLAEKMEDDVKARRVCEYSKVTKEVSCFMPK